MNNYERNVNKSELFCSILTDERKYSCNIRTKSFWFIQILGMSGSILNDSDRYLILINI